MPSWWSSKDERQYQHVLKSTGSKQIAAATVNKHRAKKEKKKRITR